MKIGVYADLYSTLSSVSGFSSSDWESSTGLNTNCPSGSSGGCIRAQNITNARVIITHTFAKAGTISFLGVRAGGSQNCTFTITGATSNSTNFNSDNLYRIDFHAGTNTFTWKDSDPGTLVGNRCFIDDVRY
ncbi:MAG: hypothetical protein AAF518_18270 [Spirochaetota bacterium]